MIGRWKIYYYMNQIKNQVKHSKRSKSPRRQCKLDGMWDSPLSQSSVHARMSEASASLLATPASLQSSQCFNHSSNIDKNGSFPLYFVIFKSGFFPVLTCFEKYFIFHNESIYCAPRAIARQKSSLAHPSPPQ